MKPKVKIVDLFPKYLFWDMDYNKLDVDNDKAIIIPRALYATTTETFEADIQLLERLYSSSDIVKYLKQTKENISNKVCLRVANRYHVKPFQRFVLPI
ncbi:DUF6922 domain-containing protein [Flavobacterium sp. NPDC079362]|uniref:DUF6922 domain-containing protein n=1 Tax=Flavobacterium sp. NPDC079362 TaxID=3390566 RepID=UPI003CFE8216